MPETNISRAAEIRAELEKLAPVGDWIRKTWPDNPGATHYLGPGDDPGCCAGGHARCTYEAGWREALSSLAAEFDRLAAETSAEVAAHEASNDDDVACMAAGARDAWQDAAARARAHARSVRSASNEAATVSAEARAGQDGTEPLSPAQAYIAGAERARIITVARKMGAAYPVTLEPEPGSEGSTRHAWFPFGDYLEDVPAERQGERADG